MAETNPNTNPEPTQEQNPQNTNPQNNGGAQTVVLSDDDISKISTMLAGTLSAKQDTALKSYFKQMGLSQEDAEKAMNEFKTKQEANKPDVNALNTEIAALKEQIKARDLKDAVAELADTVSLDVKATSLALNEIDKSKIYTDKGELDKKKLETEMKAFIEKYPMLKKQEQNNQFNFQVGAGKPAGKTPGNSGKAKSSKDIIKGLF